eukprot:IDg20452t1
MMGDRDCTSLSGRGVSKRLNVSGLTTLVERLSVDLTELAKSERSSAEERARETHSGTVACTLLSMACLKMNIYVGFYAIPAELIEHAQSQQGRVQIRATPQSTVLRIGTDQRNVYVKCSARGLNDAAVTAAMSKVAPELANKPIAVEVEERIMLIRDHGAEMCGIFLTNLIKTASLN